MCARLAGLRGRAPDDMAVDGSSMVQAQVAWAVAIFTSREAPDVVLEAVVAATQAASVPTVIDVLVNGNPRLADAVARRCVAEVCSAGVRARIRVWHIELGDKAHCWNEYVSRLWPGAEATFFVDGYVRVKPNALEALVRAMGSHGYTLAASGVPTVGRSAHAIRIEMSREGGIHGNLFALKRSTMDALREKGFKLPLGIYRTDPTLAAALAFGLDPSRHAWEPRQRIAVAYDATWDVETKHWWRWSDVRASLRRMDRQAQGELENKAVAQWLATCKRSPYEMPSTVLELVRWWSEEAPGVFDSFVRGRRRLRRAWQHLREPRDWAASATPPTCLLDSNCIR